MGFGCWAGDLSSCREGVCSPVAVRGLLIAVASLVAERGLWGNGLQSLQHRLQ